MRDNDRYLSISSCGFIFLSKQTPPLPGPSPGEGDDLVFSGAGSGCDMDDEDECIPVFDTGSGKGVATGSRPKSLAIFSIIFTCKI